jgi:hypothetical protein
MRLPLLTAVLVTVGISAANAQVASHAPTSAQTLLSAKGATSGVQVRDVPVARVNGAVLTDRDLLREMFAIFPYARQHNGFPRALEPEIRKGALEMIVFEELVYQEAKRRHLTIPPARLARAETEFRKQFPSRDVYEQFLRVEMNGSRQALRERIRRSLLIEAVLKTDVQSKAVVSVAEAKAYYDRNPQRFERDERFSIQTISIIPPQDASATKSYREFGLLAERISDDDWRVNMGDRKLVDRAQLPPPLVAAASKMKPGEVSDLLQFGPNYTLFRLNAHMPAGKADFAAVKTQVQSDLQKARYNELRAELHKKLRNSAKVEVL